VASGARDRAIDRAVCLLQRLGRRFGLDIRRELKDRRYVGPTPERRRAAVISSAEVDFVVDVGANVGQYALEARENGYTGPIVSFEPVSACYAALERTAANDPAWTCRRLALGSEPGRATIGVSANDGKSSSFLAQRELEISTVATMRYVGEEQVEVTTLDALSREVAGDARRALLKLDVQGFELEVLKGAEDFLRYVAVVDCELSLVPLYHGAPTWLEVIDHLDSRGFDLWALEPAYSDWQTGRALELDALFHRRVQLGNRDVGEGTDRTSRCLPVDEPPQTV
jgi:FkbM family methyltransferase